MADDTGADRISVQPDDQIKEGCAVTDADVFSPVHCAGQLF